MPSPSLLPSSNIPTDFVFHGLRPIFGGNQATGFAAHDSIARGNSRPKACRRDPDSLYLSPGKSVIPAGVLCE
jgi:hypothetical protein